MSSVTIHNLDEPLARLLRARARAEGLSLNQTVKRLLEEALGVKRTPSRHRADFEEFCGIWSKEEADAFDRRVSDFEQIDPEDWR